MKLTLPVYPGSLGVTSFLVGSFTEGNPATTKVVPLAVRGFNRVVAELGVLVLDSSISPQDIWLDYATQEVHIRLGALGLTVGDRGLLTIRMYQYGEATPFILCGPFEFMQLTLVTL